MRTREYECVRYARYSNTRVGRVRTPRNAIEFPY